MIVADASVLATALADDGADGERLRDHLTGRHLVAPELVYLEVASVWRRAERRGKLSGSRARQALTDLIELPLARASHGPLLGRIWELRHNLTPYDAAYVALAEFLEVPLLTGDERLAGASGVGCKVVLVR